MVSVYRLRDCDMGNVLIEFEIEVPKHTEVMETMPYADGRTDGQADKMNPVYSYTNFIAWGYVRLFKCMDEDECQKKAISNTRWSESMPWYSYTGSFVNQHPIPIERSCLRASLKSAWKCMWIWSKTNSIRYHAMLQTPYVYFGCIW